MVILGIDPGLSGGLAFITWDNAISSNKKNMKAVDLIVMPTVSKSKKSNKRMIDTNKLNSILFQKKPDFVFIEKVFSRPGEGVVSAFTFGFGAGILEGLVVANNLKFEYISPIEWTRYFYNIVPHPNPKFRSQAYVDKFYPDISFLATPKSKVPHQGILDAFMISLYGKTKLFR